jgi:predicted ferric reductase
MEEQNSLDYRSSLNGQTLLVLFIAGVLGTLVAVLVLPAWLPGLAGSLSGASPSVFWYLSRATAFVAMGLLWASMMLGVGITNKMARLWPGAPEAHALHEYVSLLGLGFATFHGLILLGDAYSQYTLAQLLVPFASSTYLPFWVGLGQIGFYTWAILVVSFYLKKVIGQKAWRMLHFVSFFTWIGALLHGIVSGSDSGLAWVQAFYWITGASFLFMLVYRIVARLTQPSVSNTYPFLKEG